MIKFFRHIRHSLINQNKMGKYFKYAIGEIILVVIGILIALSINNWNEKNKQEKVEISYLKRLANDLEKDKILWKNTHDSRKQKVSIIQNVIALNFNERKDTIGFQNLAANMKIALTWTEINPNQNTFSEMLSSGNLDIIKNDSIKIKLIALNNNYTSMLNWDKSSELTHSRITAAIQPHYSIKDHKPLDPIFSEYVDIQFTKENIEKAMTAMQESLLNIISNKQIINNLDVLSDNYHRQLSAFNRLESDVDDLIELIAYEIKSRTDD